METKTLLAGLIGFFIGGLLVSIVATTYSAGQDNAGQHTPHISMNTPATMDQMSDVLKNKTGDEFDEAFISGMIVHHEGAIDMAKMAESQAKHDEIKQLSRAIITAQESEIAQMKQWQQQWNYSGNDSDDADMHMSH